MESDPVLSRLNASKEKIMFTDEDISIKLLITSKRIFHWYCDIVVGASLPSEVERLNEFERKFFFSIVDSQLKEYTNERSE